MAITFFGGPPGAGKSYALVEQVIVPGVMAGRRVLTNVAGVDPDKVFRYCAERSEDPSQLGQVVLFDGRQATQPGFFPTEEIDDAGTFVKGGDLIVFDEWRLYWPRRGSLPSPDLEPFLRWHRHLVNGNGIACDVAIASQLATDVHQDFRGLIERSYKFKKLKAVGLNKAYAWDVFEGHLQPKGGAYDKGNGTYKDEITALYSSYATSGKAMELATDKRATIFKSWLIYAIAAGLIAFGVSAWFVWDFFSPKPSQPATDTLPAIKPHPSYPTAQGVASVPAPPSEPEWSIAGYFDAPSGLKIVLRSRAGHTRIVGPGGFNFEDRRPVFGFVDGKRVEWAMGRPPASTQQQPTLLGSIR